MELREVLISVWKQVLLERRDTVELLGSTYRPSRTRARGLLCVAFPFQGHVIDGIEQNPETKSRWAKMAQEGRQIMQFSTRGRYFANVCDGALTRYPAWASLGLPA